MKLDAPCTFYIDMSLERTVQLVVIWKTNLKDKFFEAETIILFYICKQDLTQWGPSL